MCTQVFFKNAGKVAGSIGELVEALGNDVRPKVRRGYGGAKILRESGSCLCPIDIDATFARTDYILSRWEHGFDYTVRKPQWLLEQERRAYDRARYDAAMAEMRSQHSPCSRR